MNLVFYLSLCARSHSPSFEDDFGVSKETLLHGSYADYIKEYSSRSSRSGGGPGSSSGPSQIQVHTWG